MNSYTAVLDPIFISKMQRNLLSIKMLLAAVLLIGIASTVGLSFWKQEIKYQLPSPIPTGFQEVPLQTIIRDSSISFEDSKPTLLHFFNPECSCSKFNSKHVKELIATYKDSVHFVLVIPAGCDADLVYSFFPKTLQIIADKDLKLARTCGVYSTPQAVILTRRHLLWYRGNYNKTRYCTSKATNYAERALISLLSNKHDYQPWALKAYGCSLFNIE